MADRIGPDQMRRRPRLLLVAAVLSLALWTAIGWGLGWLFERLGRS